MLSTVKNVLTIHSNGGQVTGGLRFGGLGVGGQVEGALGVKGQGE